MSSKKPVASMLLAYEFNVITIQRQRISNEHNNLFNKMEMQFLANQSQQKFHNTILLNIFRLKFEFKLHPFRCYQVLDVFHIDVISPYQTILHTKKKNKIKNESYKRTPSHLTYLVEINSNSPSGKQKR